MMDGLKRKKLHGGGSGSRRWDWGIGHQSRGCLRGGLGSLITSHFFKDLDMERRRMMSDRRQINKWGVGGGKNGRG
jgi:N-methylhydantoinase B/oxoprolinase/acetone carboxylase alpha subunit